MKTVAEANLTRQSRRSSKALWVVGSMLALIGCGSGDDNGGGGSSGGSGTVKEPWTRFCTGTFTAETPIFDAFDRPIFKARVGEEYLLSDFDDAFGGRAEFLFLTDAGPDSFELEPDAQGAWPFTSTCTIGAAVPYYAAFTDVAVFAEQELATKLCDLSAGSVLPTGGGGRGYGFVTAQQGAAIYELILGPFGAQCGGVTKGYVRVPQTTSFGASTYLVPVAGVVGPD